MSLRHLLYVTFSLLFMLIIGVVFATNIQNSQRFIENQLYSNAQNTAYALGMSLGTVRDLNNTVQMELMIQAIFDSGYYEYVRFYDADGGIRYNAQLPVVVKDVPAWFIERFAMDVPEADATVSSNWINIGKLAIKSHAGYAYYQLWSIFKDLIITFLVISVVSLLLIYIITKSVLQSLERVREQAEAISQQKFVIEEKLPFITEFRTLIKTMNAMVRKVESIFETGARTFEEYQKLLYYDQETSLMNKNLFTIKLKEAVDIGDNDICGSIALISMEGLDELKAAQGYDIYRESLRKLVEVIRNNLPRHHTIARISPHEIAILFDAKEIVHAREMIETLNEKLHVSTTKLMAKSQKICTHLGYVRFLKKDDITQILSRADYALNHAKTFGMNEVDEYRPSNPMHQLLSLGKHAWREKIEMLLNQNDFIVAMQPVQSVEGRIFHQEALLRIKERDGTMETAGYYLPMAESLGMVHQFDHYVIKNLMSDAKGRDIPTAVNICKEFVIHTEHVLWLREQLSKLEKPDHFHFECKESDVLQSLDAFCEFADMVHSQRHAFGIDHFAGLDNIDYIKILRPDYIKININYILQAQKENPATLNTLNILSKTMNFTLIITAVQDESSLKTLQKLGYLYFQGNYISKPLIIDN